MWRWTGIQEEPLLVWTSCRVGGASDTKCVFVSVIFSISSQPFLYLDPHWHHLGFRTSGEFERAGTWPHQITVCVFVCACTCMCACMCVYVSLCMWVSGGFDKAMMSVFESWSSCRESCVGQMRLCGSLGCVWGAGLVGRGGVSLLTHDKKSLTHDLWTPDMTKVEPFPLQTAHMVSLSNIMA